MQGRLTKLRRDRLLLAALVTCFVTVMVLLAMDDYDDSYYEAEDRDWLGEDSDGSVDPSATDGARTHGAER